MNSPIRKMPWILRECPERYRQKLIEVGVYVGWIGCAVFLLAGLYTLVRGPLDLCSKAPGAPISKIVNRFQRLFPSHDAFSVVYLLVMVAIAGVLLTGISILDYVRREGQPDPKSERPSSDRALGERLTSNNKA